MNRSSRRRGALFCAAMLVVLGMAGCGSSHKDPSAGHFAPLPSSVHPVAGGEAQSGPIIAEVAGAPIYKSQFDSRMAMEVRGEAEGTQFLPVPPEFSVCISRLTAVAPKPTNGPLQSTTQLRASCREVYRKLLRKVLGPLISGQWVIREAAADGVAPTEAQVKQRFEYYRSREFRTEARLRAYLASTGETIPDMLFNVEEGIALQALFDRIHTSIARTATDAMVTRYYDENRRVYTLNERRNIGLIRTTSATEAMRVKHELESGVSFESIARRLAPQQPVYTFGKALIIGLKPRVYSEPELNDPIFAAKQGVVVGPLKVDVTRLFRHTTDPAVLRKVRLIDGYYVVRVNKIVRPSQVPLAQVKTAISRQLPIILYKQAVAAFVQAWRARWTARTSCHGEFITRRCQQFSPSQFPGRLEPGEAPLDLYTFN